VSRSDSTDTGPDNIGNGDTVDHASRVIPVRLVMPVHVTVSIGSVADPRSCNSNRTLVRNAWKQDFGFTCGVSRNGLETINIRHQGSHPMHSARAA
jgi:hypothetical protein